MDHDFVHRGVLSRMVGRLVFFFSSRRRHTRLVSDWSSDVCSSDLGRSEFWRHSTRRKAWEECNHSAPTCKRVSRSEERRVGKECRSRWWACHLNKTGEASWKDRSGVGSPVQRRRSWLVTPARGTTC